MAVIERETMRFPSYEEAETFIKELEDSTVTRFTVFKKTKDIAITRVESANVQIKWEETQGELPMVFDGVPFIIIGKEDRECANGPQRKKPKRKTNQERETDDHTYDGGHPKRNLIQDTKKMGCPMKIKMRMIVRFPGYAIECDSAHHRRTSSLKLKSEFNESTQQEYCVFLKVIGQHENHETGELAGYGQSLDSTTVGKIRDLVLVNGLTDIGEIRRQVEAFSKLQHPDIHLSNRRYFPTTQDVRNHVFLALNNTRYSQDDQLNIQRLVTSWRETNPEDFYFFRAASVNEDDGVKTLLFAHQTQFQQHMLMKYGRDVVVMDSTYKTSKYELPLFFLCVLTNVGYMVVATFLVGKESRFHITEALQKIQGWNKNWNPKSFMVDLDQREIGALEDVFKEARVFICDFHREQAWDRWFNKRENGAQASKKETIQYLRQIARSRTEDDLNENIKALQGTEIYNNNRRFRSWIERYWIANKQRWVHCFRTTIMNLKVNTTNGNEAHHKVLKEKYLHGKGSSKTLTNLLTEIAQKFIPDSRDRYIRENVAARNTSRKYSNEVPFFLRDRPQRFVKHCMQRIYSGDSLSITETESGFNVQSDSGNAYQVDCDQPSCTCEDFHKFYWPCKHLLGVMTQYPGHGWDFLPQEYTELPIFNTDFHPTDSKPTPDYELPPVEDDHTKASFKESTRDSLIELLKELQNDIYIADEDTLSEVHSHIVATLDVMKKKQSVDLPIRPSRKKKRSTFCTVKQKEAMEDDKNGVHLPGKSNLSGYKFGQLGADVCRAQVKFSPFLPDGYKPEENHEVCNEVENIWMMNITEIEPRLIGPYVITADSIRYINSRLPDEVIDSFIHEMVHRQKNDTIYHLNCIAMTAIFEGEERIHHCLRGVPSLMAYDMIIGAYNQGRGHWCLIIIHPKDRQIFFLNPLGTLRVHEQDIVLKWFKFLKARFDAGLESELPDTWKINTPKHAKQFDSISCGVFALKFAENYLEGRSLDFTWSVLDLEKARLSLAVFLLSISQPRTSVEDEPNVTPDIVLEEHERQDNIDKGNTSDEYQSLINVLFKIMMANNDVSENATVLEEHEMQDNERQENTDKENTSDAKDDVSENATVLEEHEMQDNKRQDNSDKENTSDAKDDVSENATVLEEHERQDNIDKGNTLDANNDVSENATVLEEHEMQDNERQENTDKENTSDAKDDVSENATVLEEHEMQDNKRQDNSDKENTSDAKDDVSENATVLEEHERQDNIDKGNTLDAEDDVSENATVLEEHELQDNERQEKIDEENTSYHKVYYFREQKPKRKRSSFLYWTPKKRQRKHYCVCQKPDDGRKYWGCDGCESWFHPACVGRKEENEDEVYLCPSCEIKVTESKDSSDLEVVDETNACQLWMDKYDEIMKLLVEIVCCEEKHCNEVEHRRHHSFCQHPETYIQTSLKLYLFGRDYFSEESERCLYQRMTKDLLISRPDPKRPVTGLAISTLKCVPNQSRLGIILADFKLIATKYIQHVLMKDFMVFVVCLLKGSPFQHADELCKETEIDFKVLLKKKKARHE